MSSDLAGVVLITLGEQFFLPQHSDLITDFEFLELFDSLFTLLPRVQAVKYLLIKPRIVRLKRSTLPRRV